LESNDPPPAYPRYAIPPGMVIRIAASILLKQPRSFHRDAEALAARIEPPLQVHGCEHVPHSGPCVVTGNHYTRPGFGAWWVALAIAAVIPAEMHWIMTGAWTFPGRWYRGLLRPISERLFARIAHVYGFTVMPPMPPDPAEAEARARAVRRVLAHARRAPEPLIGLVPEGRDFPGGALGWPPAGAGRFIQHLVRMGLGVIPVGIYEEDGALCVSVGPRYVPDIPDGLPPDARDRAMSGLVMARIARQLPARLRGEFGE
jgi:hypothetical protein